MNGIIDATPLIGSRKRLTKQFTRIEIVKIKSRHN